MTINARGRQHRILPLLIVSLLIALGSTAISGIPIGETGTGDPAIVAAGDIACDPADASFDGGLGSATACRQQATANLIGNIKPAAVLTLGDTQYYCGGYTAFLESYDLSWGQFRSITFPAVGNHEYLTQTSSSALGTGCDSTNANAAGYFKYFGAAAGDPSQGYYSYDLGTWHLIALNSNCANAGGCNSTSPQGQWLNADLAAHPHQCILAYWHIPLWSSGGRAELNMQAATQTLYNYKADVVLTGHDHIYERFAPQDPEGNLDPTNGIRAFVVGTGGARHSSIATLAPNSEITNTNTFGVLELTLHPGSYGWQFVPENVGGFSDSGMQDCHNQPLGTATGSATSTETPTSTPTPISTRTPKPTETTTLTPTPTQMATPIPEIILTPTLVAQPKTGNSVYLPNIVR